MKPRIWTDQDRADFTAAWAVGEKRVRIAARFNICESKVSYWRIKFGLPPRAQTNKKGPYSKTAGRRSATCLCCDRTFLSDGPHNRICKPCRETVEFTAGDGIPSPVYHVRHRGTL